MRKLILSLSTLVFFVALLSCRDRHRRGDGAPVLRQGTLALVNGVPITRSDVEPAPRVEGHQPATPPEGERALLDRTILEELQAQRVHDLGLDSDAKYQEELQLREAKLATWKRKRLAELFDRREVIDKAVVSDDEARAYFDEHASRLRTEVHVLQILLRDGLRIQQAKKDLDAGTPFEDVAARQFPTLPPTQRKPWDLGYLHWNQIPEPWREAVYRLDKAEVSDVLGGPGGRFWVIKLVDRRENTAVTFEATKSQLIDVLRAEKAVKLRQQRAHELRSRAQILYLDGAPAAPSKQ